LPFCRLTPDLLVTGSGQEVAMNRRLLAAAVLAVALAACESAADVEPGSPMQADTLTPATSNPVTTSPTPT
jgi:hypothetical protein